MILLIKDIKNITLYRFLKHKEYCLNLYKNISEIYLFTMGNLPIDYEILAHVLANTLTLYLFKIKTALTIQ